MTTSVEIEVESEKCEYCGADKAGAEIKPSKDAMLAELKGLLADSSSNGQAERQMKIDELISKINELKED
jgi:hypothetical protein